MVKKRNVVKKSVLFFLMIMAILFFCLFPFAQMLSLSLNTPGIGETFVDSFEGEFGSL